jgi:hypothetical protein
VAAEAKCIQRVPCCVGGLLHPIVQHASPRRVGLAREAGWAGLRRAARDVGQVGTACGHTSHATDGSCEARGLHRRGCEIDGRDAPSGGVDASRRSEGVKALDKLGVEPEGLRCGARLLWLADEVAVGVAHRREGEVLRRMSDAVCACDDASGAALVEFGAGRWHRASSVGRTAQEEGKGKSMHAPGSGRCPSSQTQHGGCGSRTCCD